MESTFMQASARTANLKALLSDNPEIRAQVAATVKACDLIAGPSAVEFDANPHSPVPSSSQWISLPRRERQLLHQYLRQKHGESFGVELWRASGIIMDEIWVGGVGYARQNVRKYDCDSHILFRKPAHPELDDLTTGKILNIFEYWFTAPDGSEIKGTYLIIEEFNVHPIPPDQDPYRKYTAFGYLADTVGVVDTYVIEDSHILAHCALTSIVSNGVNLTHVLPVTQVSPTSSTCHAQQSFNVTHNQSRYQHNVHGFTTPDDIENDNMSEEVDDNEGF